MNRTIEQWQSLARFARLDNTLNEAISDMQELARQLDTERAAWAAEKTKLLCSNEHELSDALLAELEK